MKKPLLIILLLLYIQPSYAQQSLLPGDTIPATLAATIQAISDQKNPLGNNHLLIIDFWATWCGACLKKFPLLDSMQQSWAPCLETWLVNSTATGDSPEKIAAFFTTRRNPNGQPYRLRVFTNDTLWQNLFPHTVIPHYVWIYNNRVLAITGTEEVTAANIAAVLTGTPPCFPVKMDEPRHTQQQPKNQP